MYGTLIGLIFWLAAASACYIDLSFQQPPLTSLTLEPALRTALVTCPSPQALYLNFNQISSLPEVISYNLLGGWHCVSDPLLTVQQSLEDCQGTCTNRSNCSYVFLAQNGDCSLFGGSNSCSNSSSVAGNESSSGAVYQKVRELMFLSNLVDLGYLELSMNNLTTIPSSLKGLSLLTRLELGSNLISSIPADAFSGLTRLQILNLFVNNLNSVPENLFQNLSSLLQLSLLRNRLTALPENIFFGLPRLTSLIFSTNQLRGLPPQIFRNLTSLEALDFGLNYIPTFPNGQLFMGLAKLRTLYFENITLTALPTDIFNGLVNLRDLRFCNNQIKQFPDGLFNGLSLNRLDACYNRLSSIPEDIFWSQPLQTIRLGNNQLTSLDPNTFQGLSSLLWLDLQNNLLKSLPSDIFSTLASLTILQLSRPPECLQTGTNGCSGVVRVGSTLRSFIVPSVGVTQAPSSLAPTIVPTVGVTQAPSSLAPTIVPTAAPNVPPVVGSQGSNVESDVNALTIGMICLGVVLFLCCCCFLLICWGRHRKWYRKRSPSVETAPVEPFDAHAPEHRLIQRNNSIPQYPPPLYPTLTAPYTKDGVQFYIERRGSTPEAKCPQTPGLAVPVLASCATTPSLTPNPLANTSRDYDSPQDLNSHGYNQDHHEQRPFILSEVDDDNNLRASNNNPVFVKGTYKYSAFRMLGRGHFGTAYLVMDPKMQVFVLKTIACTDQNEALKEAKTLSLNTPSSPHLLKILDFFFETDQLFCILMNYCRGGSLQDLVSEKLPPNEVERILREIATGLEALHATGLIHRDLKPDNIFLLDPKVRTVVIGDMGLARFGDEEGYYSSWFGHMLYKAPEIDEGKFSPRSDMWAVGCIGLELLSGEPLPARYQKDKLCLGKSSNEEIKKELDALPENCKHYAVYKMVCGLLVRDPRARLSATQVKLFPPGDSDYSSRLVLAGNRFTSWNETPVAVHVVQGLPQDVRALENNAEHLMVQENGAQIRLDFDDQILSEPLQNENSSFVGANAALPEDHYGKWEAPIYHGENGAVGRPVLDDEENGDEFFRDHNGSNIDTESERDFHPRVSAHKLEPQSPIFYSENNGKRLGNSDHESKSPNVLGSSYNYG